MCIVFGNSLFCKQIKQNNNEICHNHFKYSYKQTNKKPHCHPVNCSISSPLFSTAFYAIYLCYSICSIQKCKTNIVQTNIKLLFLLVESYSDILKIISTTNFSAYFYNIIHHTLLQTIIVDYQTFTFYPVCVLYLFTLFNDTT